jgi:hypothetical protein
MTEAKRNLISNILALGFLGVAVGIVLTIVAGEQLGEMFLIGVALTAVLGGLGAWAKMTAAMDSRGQKMGPTPVWPVAVFGAGAIVLNEFVSFSSGTEMPCQHCAHSPAALLPLATGVVVLVVAVGGQLVWSAIGDEAEGES